MSRRIYRHDMTTYLTLGFLFDGGHKRIYFFYFRPALCKASVMRLI
jgi:hypothetical protein